MINPRHRLKNRILIASNHSIRLPNPADRIAAELPPLGRIGVAVAEAEEFLLGACVEGAEFGVVLEGACGGSEEGLFGEDGGAVGDLLLCEYTVAWIAAGDSVFVEGWYCFCCSSGRWWW